MKAKAGRRRFQTASVKGKLRVAVTAPRPAYVARGARRPCIRVGRSPERHGLRPATSGSASSQRGAAPRSLYLAAVGLERRSCIAMADSVLGLCFCNAARPLAVVGTVESKRRALPLQPGPTDVSAQGQSASARGRPRAAISTRAHACKLMQGRICCADACIACVCAHRIRRQE